MAVGMDQVKKLREMSGAGMMDCKNALEEAGGDLDKAFTILREKGIAKAAKRADRATGQGVVEAYLHSTSPDFPPQLGVLIEVNCETDFVAKNEGFQELAAKIAQAAIDSKAADRLALLAAAGGDGKTVEQLIEDASASIKEKLELGRFARFEGGYVHSYLHKSDRDLPPTLGVLVQLDKENDNVAKDLAQHIAAMRPQYTKRDEVPVDVVDRERRIFEQITRDEGKPEAAIAKIVEGRVGGFYKDIVLTEQAFVKDNKQSIAQVLKAGGVDVKGFARFQVGQA
jgi:elongation factor Ts